MRTKNIFGVVDYTTPTGLRKQSIVALPNKGDIAKFRRIVLELSLRLDISKEHDVFIIPAHMNIHLKKTYKTPSNTYVLAEGHAHEVKLTDFTCTNNNVCERFYTSVVLAGPFDEIDYANVNEFEKDWVSRVFKDLNITENNDTSNTEEVPEEEEECASVIKLKELKNEIDVVINKINLSNEENEYTTIAGVSDAIKVSSGVDISAIIQKLNSVKDDILGDTKEKEDGMVDAIRHILQREHIAKNLFGPRIINTVRYIGIRENTYVTSIGIRIVNKSEVVLEGICLTGDVTVSLPDSFIGFYDTHNCTITRCGNNIEHINLSNKVKWSAVDGREVSPLEYNGELLNVEIFALDIEAII